MGSSAFMLSLGTLVSLHYLSFASAMECGRGSFLIDGVCKMCPRGTFQNKKNATSCEPCPPGTYNPFKGAQGLDVCIECPSGTFRAKPGATSKRDCKKCPTGQNAPQGSPDCIACRAGQAITSCETSPSDDFSSTYRGLCLGCLGGNLGSSCSVDGPIKLKCENCFPGFFSAKASSLECERCPEGFTSDAGASKCKAKQGGRCGAGMAPGYPPGTCEKCSRNEFNDGTTEECQVCPVGHTGEFRTGSTKCVPCPSGTFKNDKYSNCKKCKDGFNTNVTGAQYCLPDNAPCPPNFFRSKGGACLTCTVHERYDKKGKNCIPCPANSLSKGGFSTKCKKCGRGMITMDDYSRCLCKEGWGFVEGSNGTKCKKCPPGSEGGSNTSICRKCDPGSYSNKRGSDSCFLCADGFSQPLEGQTKCVRDPPCAKGLIRRKYRGCVVPQTNCPPNTIRQGSGSDSEPHCKPQACPSGKALIYMYFGLTCGTCLKSERYDPKNMECDSCKSNEFSEGGVSQVCKKCPEGLMSYEGICRCLNGRFWRNGKCKKCPKGTFGFNHIDGCLPCPAGTASSRLQLEGCTKCKPGFFTSEPGQKTCKPCPEGLTSFGLGDTGCVKFGDLKD